MNKATLDMNKATLDQIEAALEPLINEFAEKHVSKYHEETTGETYLFSSDLVEFRNEVRELVFAALRSAKDEVSEAERWKPAMIDRYCSGRG